MNRFDSALRVAGKVFAFSAIASILAPLAALSLLFFSALPELTGSSIISLLILFLLLVGVRTVSALVSDWIEAPKSLHKLLFVKLLPVFLFLLLASLGCIGTQCFMMFHPG